MNKLALLDPSLLTTKVEIVRNENGKQIN